MKQTLKNVLLVAINSKYIHTNPAVYCLQSYAEKYGKKISISEYTINEYTDDILADIYGQKPSLLMFSCYIWNITTVECIVRNIKKLLPETDIYLGGPEVSYDSEDILNRLSEVSGIMLGEGEETLIELLDSYEDPSGIISEDIKNIRGLMIQGNRKIIGRSPMDMDDIPFLYGNNIPKDKILYYESSRGCPFSCCYCLSSVEKQVRFKKLDIVYAELMKFIENDVKQVKFVDRTFNCNEERTLAIWEFLIKNDNKITNFHFEIAGDLLTERELELIKMMRPGLIQLEIGVQTVNEKSLEIVARHTDFIKLENAVAAIIKNGNIHVHLDLIAGLPKESFVSFKNSFNTVYAMKPNQLQLGFLKLLKGSSMREMCERYGIIYRMEPPYEVLSTDDISYTELQQLKRIETVLEIYYNSGQFVNSILFLNHFSKDAFVMYEELADLYYSGDKAVRSRSRMFRAELLLKFAEKILPEEHIDTFREILTFDMYLREKMKTRPEFAVTQQMKKNERVLYLSENTEAHAEYMTINPVKSADAGYGIQENSVAVFDYGKRDIEGNAEVAFIISLK